MDAAQAQLTIAVVRAALGELAFRAPPPQPNTCCGKGCAGCVWGSYYDAVNFWLNDAQALLGQIRRNAQLNT